MLQQHQLSRLLTSETDADSIPSPPPSVGPVDGVVEPVNKLTVFAPYLALFGIVAAVAVVAVAPWKRARN
jgi:hypothetical protein